MPNAEPPRIACPNPDSGVVDPGLVADVVAALNVYPYFIVLTGRAAEENPYFTVALAIAMTASPEDRAAMTIVPVRYDPKTAETEGKTTSFSATADALEAHTDSSFLIRPHELIAFQFVQTAPGGGDTVILPVENFLGRLTEAERADAGALDFPFGNGMHTAVTRDAAGAPSIRFYRTQIDKSAGGAVRREDRRRLADALSASARHEDYRFHAEAGEIVLINNAKALHSRTAYDPASGRLMWRVRCHSSLLG